MYKGGELMSTKGKKQSPKNSVATLTPEEIANNHVVIPTKKSYFLVYGIFALSVLVVILGSLFRNKITPDYPLVFKDANNKLMFITKSSDGKSDITKIEEANIVYANADIRYLLYTNKDKLYLLDTTQAGEGTLLSDNVKSYGFSYDDKAIYYIENNDELHVYLRKNGSDYLIDNNVNKAEDVVGSFVIYNKGENLTVKNFNEGTTDVIAKRYSEIILSKDAKYMLYSILDAEDTYSYYVYNFLTLDNERVLSDVYKLLDMNSTFTKFIYTAKNKDAVNIYNYLSDSSLEQDRLFTKYTEEDVNSGKITRDEYNENLSLASKVEERNKMRDYAKNYKINGYDLYYQNKATTTILAKGINQVFYNDIEDLRVSYSKDSWSEKIDIANYETLEELKKAIKDNKENSLYFQVGTGASSKVSDSVNEDILVYYAKDGIYYVSREDGINKLYYSKVVNKRASLASVVDENLKELKLQENYSLGLVYLTDENNNSSLKYIDGGKYKVINENVEYYKIAEDKESIYYIKDYENHCGNLMIFNGIRNSKVVDNVSSFMYINEELMYVTMNYNEETKTSDLYRLNGTKTTLIYKDILEWYNPPIRETKEK